MNLTPLLRALTAGAAGLLLSATGALALAAPVQAQAHDTAAEVVIADDCEGVKVTVEGRGTNRAWRVLVAGDVAAPEGTSLDDTPRTVSPWPIQIRPLEVRTIELGGVSADQVTVQWWAEPRFTTWDTHEFDTRYVVHECETDEEDEQDPLTGEIEVTPGCDRVTVTVGNPSDVEVTFTLVVGESSQSVTVPAGETSDPVEVGAVDGDQLDLLVDGESVLVDGPRVVEVLPAGACREDGGGEGAEEELPVTGGSTLLIAAASLMLLAAGAGLYRIGRRQRTFTA